MGSKKCIYFICKLSLGVVLVVVVCGLGFLVGFVGSVFVDEMFAVSYILEIDKFFSESIDKDKFVEGLEKEVIVLEE